MNEHVGLTYRRCPPGSRQQALRRKMHEASTYQEWAQLAKELDVVVGNEKWKTDKRSPFFDHVLIDQKTKLFANLMESNDADGLIWHLRKGLLRVRQMLVLFLPYVILLTRSQRQGGVGHSDLFSQTHVGTKYVVEEYIDQVCKSLRFVLYTPLVQYSPTELREVPASGTILSEVISRV